MAARNNTAIVCVSHLNKGGNSQALMRVTGSLAFVATARAAFLVAEHEEQRVFVPLKNNIGDDSSGITYSIVEAILDNQIETSRIVWGDTPIKLHADDVLNHSSDPEERSSLDEAKEFLTELLTNNPLAAKEVFKEADNGGHSKSTIHRAKKQLRVKSEKSGFSGQWRWSLEVNHRHEDSQETCPETLATLSTLETFDTKTGDNAQDHQDRQDCQTGNAGRVGTKYEAPFVGPKK